MAIWSRYAGWWTRGPILPDEPLLRVLPPPPLLRKLGTDKTVKASFWPWLPGKSPYTLYVVPSSLGSGNPINTSPPRNDP